VKGEMSAVAAVMAAAEAIEMEIGGICGWNLWLRCGLKGLAWRPLVDWLRRRAIGSKLQFAGSRCRTGYRARIRLGR
jgi:hypothetical protein